MTGATEIPLSTASIIEFSINWSGINDVIKSAEKIGFIVDEYDEDDSLVADIYKYAKLCDIHTIADLQKSLIEDYQNYLRDAFAIYAELEPDQSTKWHASPDFLVLLLLFAGRRDKFSLDYLLSDGWGDTNAAAVAKAIQKNWPV